MKEEETRQSRLQREMAEENLHRAKSAFQAVAATAEGRVAFWWVLEAVCGTFATTETGDERGSLVRAGERKAGLKVQHLLMEWAPAEFVRLLGENMARSTEYLSRLREEQ